MRSKLFLIPGLLLILAAAASGQTKITGTISCGKPDTSYSIDVSDRSGHAVSISKFACNWSTPMVYGDVQSKDGTDVVYADASGSKARSSGYHVSNLSNGEKIYVRFQGNDTTMDGKPGTTEGTWSYTGGTGKFKDIKGKGTYKGKADASGNMVTDVEGNYELPAAKK